MKALAALLTILCLVSPGARHGFAADEKPLDEEFLRGFMAGEYDLIGRKPDSTATYTGRVTLLEEKGTLLAIRVIAGKTDKGTVKFDTVAGADRIPVVRMRFSLGGEEYEAIYRWQSDPDNYPRFTGLVHRVGKEAKSPGLEALFPARK